MQPSNPYILSIDRFRSERNHFDVIIDVRSPAEFALDHVPGAMNCPVLNNEEREQIGTLYKQVSPFAAKKLLRGKRRNLLIKSTNLFALFIIENRAIHCAWDMVKGKFCR